MRSRDTALRCILQQTSVVVIVFLFADVKILLLLYEQQYESFIVETMRVVSERVSVQPTKPRMAEDPGTRMPYPSRCHGPIELP